MEWLLPIMAVGMFGNGAYTDYRFCGCINDYERYENQYKKYGSDK